MCGRGGSGGGGVFGEWCTGLNEGDSVCAWGVGVGVGGGHETL